MRINRGIQPLDIFLPYAIYLKSLFDNLFRFYNKSYVTQYRRFTEAGGTVIPIFPITKKIKNAKEVIKRKPAALGF